MNKDVTKQLSQEEISELYGFAVELVRQRKDREYVIKSLEQKGASTVEATRIVENLAAEIKRLPRLKSQKAKRDMLVGGIIFLAGVMLTLVSGGHLIFWGAILFGGVQFFIGLLNNTK